MNIAKKMLKTFGLLMITFFAVSCGGGRTVKFLQLNVWQEGTMVEGGYEALVDELARADADFVMLSEVRNYHGHSFARRITASLRERGKTYYAFDSYDSGLLSRHPIIDSAVVFPENGDHGSIYKLVAEVGGRRYAVYTAHLDYLNCAYYDVRGYDGLTWKRLPRPLTDIDSILLKNVASQRDDAIRLFLADAAKERRRGSLIFLGGDFNEPSHLDWTAATSHTADHEGLVIPWTVTSLLAADGYVDTYRECYPDPVAYPGYTYPANTPGAQVDELSWAMEADERERIDYIFYHRDASLTLRGVSLLAPRGDIIRGRRCDTVTADPLVEPLGVWPTDHKGLVAEFEVE